MIDSDGEVCELSPAVGGSGFDGDNGGAVCGQDTFLILLILCSKELLAGHGYYADSDAFSSQKFS